MPATIHFEGLPGAGKTTASKQFCKLLKSNGIDATWWLEEASNHPIRPKETRVVSLRHDYPQICLNAWLAFLKSSNSTVVLDGYALQSTVRFLYANRIAIAQIKDYFNKWQEIATEATLVYLPVENPVIHYDLVLAERGNEWSRKLYTYVERSPIGIAHGYQGKTGFVQFWSNYQELCHELLDAAFIPVHLIRSRSWKDDDLRTLAAQMGILPKRL